MNKTWVSAFGFIFLMFTAVVWAAPVPDTGQTKCYNNTVEIPCPSPGQPFYGQDANYTINPPSYTKLDSSGNTLPDSAPYWSMVRDNVTGLIWEIKTTDGTIHDKDNTYAWYDSSNPFHEISVNGTNTKYFIDALNIAIFGGYGDWRLPTIEELGSLLIYNIPGQFINANYFPNTQRSSYWSITPNAYYLYLAWCVSFVDGRDEYSDKTNDNYVYAVRGGQGNVYDTGYVDNGNGTVTDIATGMMWQQAGPPYYLNWEQALAYCEGLNLGGYTDWRLPAKKMLRSLVDFSRYDPSINTTYFPDTVSSFYWCSTTDLNITDNAWGRLFYVGEDDSANNKLNNGYVRAVRGGQILSPTGCMATINKNLLLHIPYLKYTNPLLGTQSLWADFVFEFNPMNPTLILFKLYSDDIIFNPSYLCAASTLTYDLKIHIPDVLLPDGSTHFWVNLEYDPALSTDGNAYFVVANYGAVSN